MSQAANVAARERYLAEASGFLTTKCQLAANECRYEGASLRRRAGRDAPEQSELQCLACGSVEVHERMVSTTIKSRGKGDKHSESELRLLKCQTCSRTTKKRIQARPSKALKTDTLERVDNLPTSAMKTADSHITSGKTSSKKRAKDRKNREGLQAMLEKNKEPAHKPTTFGLLDFMSKQS